MLNQNPPPDGAIHLSDRCLVRVSGEDAENFLQNIITNDMRTAGQGKLIYACLLMPQGFYLHDFFIGQDGEGYILDCETARIDDLLRRFAMFKLRAKVVFARIEGNIYSASEGLDDPRLADAGKRFYTANASSNERGVQAYYDGCIDLGLPVSSLCIRPEKDTMADVNLDFLNAVAWDKGCFIGQEVAARMYHKSIAKRRLYTVTGGHLKPGGILIQNANEVGDVRLVSSDGRKALSQIKTGAVANTLIPILTAQTENSERLLVSQPQYLAAKA